METARQAEGVLNELIRAGDVKQYEDGSWGTIEGEWYVVAGTQAASENLAGDCCRMKFALGDGGAAMSQWMWYEGDDGGGAAVG